MQATPFGRQIQAEAAFSVDTERRRRGIGEKLFRRIQRAAANHGVETIEIICLPDNIAMRMLARKFKTHFTFEESALTGRLRAWRPTAFSLMHEASGDVLDFCAALLDAQWRAFHEVQARTLDRDRSSPSSIHEAGPNPASHVRVLATSPWLPIIGDRRAKPAALDGLRHERSLPLALAGGDRQGLEADRRASGGPLAADRRASWAS